ncbi:hypothetical protein HYQ45_007798 [Verticillium longisporum]|uniref:Uncharacterized protein n=1 Tax=Verticillium longisporum TaxID=100787 RepID=A0A8I2ZMS8_VERLO|nr:Ankyrin repeat-containing protein [Verticillium dahliae VDG1]KAG7134188.1 hypothetical protein HYQ45_007798 [Verticillium longisporum]PNH43505.1 hypothetical protein VD0004_g3954 [Verticillium dahliae]PNH61195.1 hypothetical protein VD0001_g9739 [Verticillium dahliae]RBQ74125.1 hypothetical protein VDGD_04389 [Verticillium dahliae]
MTFTPIDPPRCAHYARFASHLERWQFDLVYWALFIFNLFILFGAAYGYSRTLEKIEELPEGSPKRKPLVVRCIIITCGCISLSVVTVVMEVFALLALQFCDGEDLMSLYWSTWTMIQVGSLIAVCGIVLALMHTLRERKNPPWALALGTPVLVVAGLFNFMQSCISRRISEAKDNSKAKSIRKSSRSGDVEDGTLPMSQVNTLQVDSDEDYNYGTEGAEIIGLTLEGGPIIHFKQAVPYTLPDNTQILGRCQNDKPIVICRKDGFQLIYNGELQKGQKQNESSSQGTASKHG